MNIMILSEPQHNNGTTTTTTQGVEGRLKVDVIKKKKKLLKNKISKYLK